MIKLYDSIPRDISSQPWLEAGGPIKSHLKALFILLFKKKIKKKNVQCKLFSSLRMAACEALWEREEGLLPSAGTLRSSPQDPRFTACSVQTRPPEQGKAGAVYKSGCAWLDKLENYLWVLKNKVDLSVLCVRKVFYKVRFTTISIRITWGCMLQEQIPGPHPDWLNQNFHRGARREKKKKGLNFPLGTKVGKRCVRILWRQWLAKTKVLYIKEILLVGKLKCKIKIKNSKWSILLCSLFQQ